MTNSINDDSVLLATVTLRIGSKDFKTTIGSTKMAKKVVDESIITTRANKHPIRPEYIGVNDHFWNAFDNSEAEVSALWIVRLCQWAGTWFPFTDEMMEDFYRKNSKFSDFSFNRLDTNGFVVLGADGKYRVTHEFICLCFKSSPNIGLFATKQAA